LGVSGQLSWPSGTPSSSPSATVVPTVTSWGTQAAPLGHWSSSGTQVGGWRSVQRRQSLSSVQPTAA
jgi:hypothetical protein